MKSFETECLENMNELRKACGLPTSMGLCSLLKARNRDDFERIRVKYIKTLTKTINKY